MTPLSKALSLLAQIDWDPDRQRHTKRVVSQINKFIFAWTCPLDIMGQIVNKDKKIVANYKQIQR